MCAFLLFRGSRFEGEFYFLISIFILFYYYYGMYYLYTKNKQQINKTNALTYRCMIVCLDKSIPKTATTSRFSNWIL